MTSIARNFESGHFHQEYCYRVWVRKDRCLKLLESLHESCDYGEIWYQTLDNNHQKALGMSRIVRDLACREKLSLKSRKPYLINKPYFSGTTLLTPKSKRRLLSIFLGLTPNYTDYHTYACTLYRHAPIVSRITLVRKIKEGFAKACPIIMQHLTKIGSKTVLYFMGSRQQEYVVISRLLMTGYRTSMY